MKQVTIPKNCFLTQPKNRTVRIGDSAESVKRLWIHHTDTHHADLTFKREGRVYHFTPVDCLASEFETTLCICITVEDAFDNPGAKVLSIAKHFPYKGDCK